MAGGLDLLSKLLGKPGKMEVSGDQVYEMHRAGRHQDINDYCLFDTLDTYFVFLRTRVLSGDLTLEQEHELVRRRTTGSPQRRVNCRLCSATWQIGGTGSRGHESGSPSLFSRPSL